ncbi:uncharacterized protein MONBRDRAFT_21527 [Monosiga brevicollis MX1]|uniref:AAA+ ATPase domain-containing protein n=1 Tax=Monosiga brevicollis TaxID=81824 RepID=A9V010_MONBE|nr:uncharacterized protein MONBRDRAFT_21527 [Monosiga brevicollis MX1]EDQ89075.1 predicted protein [Monosiga brevicollis MX1]|eukprot:XP_001746180.1 hypothetical protein [Monosiga brevicollis MX1]
MEHSRPKTTHDVAHQSEVVAMLQKCVAGGDMPHTLFYGPPGTGKTSTILAVAREFFGPQLMKERVLELNASDERGIGVVREKIKNFAVMTANTRVSGGYPCPPFKIILLDEADAMTEAAQSALRRTIEQHSNVTRFCMVCNYVSRIIEPLASRCAKFRFKPLSDATVLARLQHIRDAENVKCADEVLQTIVKVSGGDMRQAITFLQSCHRLRGDLGIETSHVEDVSGLVPQSTINELLSRCNENSFEALQASVDDAILSGFSGSQLLHQLHETLMEMEMDESKKAKILHKMAVADKRLIDGADEQLTLLDVLAESMHILNHKA